MPQEINIGSNDLPAPAPGLEPSRRLTAGAAVLLAESRGADQLDFSRAAINPQMCALRDCPSRPSPVHRTLPGPKHHVIIQAHETPPVVPLTGGNRNDITQLIPLPEAIWAVRDGLPGKTPRSRPSGWTPTVATTTTPTTRSGRVRASDRRHSSTHGVTCQLRTRGSSIHDKTTRTVWACSASGPAGRRHRSLCSALAT